MVYFFPGIPTLGSLTYGFSKRAWNARGIHASGKICLQKWSPKSDIIWLPLSYLPLTCLSCSIKQCRVHGWFSIIDLQDWVNDDWKSTRGVTAGHTIIIAPTNKMSQGIYACVWNWLWLYLPRVAISLLILLSISALQLLSPSIARCQFTTYESRGTKCG